MATYGLAIYVPDDVLDESACEACLESVREMDPQPTAVLVVDHAHGVLAATNQDSRSNHPKHYDGQIQNPTFGPRRKLWDLADKLVTAPSFLPDGWDERGLRDTNPHILEWNRAASIKCFGSVWAFDSGLDALMIARFIDNWHPDLPAAHLSQLHSRPKASFSYPLIFRGDETGEFVNGVGYVIDFPLEMISIPKEGVPWGSMIRLSAINVDALRGPGKEHRLYEQLMIGGPGYKSGMIRGEIVPYIMGQASEFETARPELRESTEARPWVDRLVEASDKRFAARDSAVRVKVYQRRRDRELDKFSTSTGVF